jgi:hypothetical protein
MHQHLKEMETARRRGVDALELQLHRVFQARRTVVPTDASLRGTSDHRD